MPYKQGNKWRAVVKFKGHRYTKLFPTKQKAKEWEIRIKETLSNDLIDMDYLMLCNSYLDHVKVRFSEKTYKEKVSVCIRFGQFIGKNTSVGQVTPKMIDDFLTKQAMERTAHAANKDRKNLLAMWNWGMKIYDLDKNPVIKIDRFAHDRKPQYTPSENDVLRVLAATSGADRVFLLCYLNTAARRSEIFNLKWDDVNFEKKEIRLWTRKTRDGSLEGEWLPMNDILSRELFWWWNNRKFKESPFVFIDDQQGPHYGKPYKVRRRFLPGLCERAGVKPFGFHALRRYVASILADRHKVSSKTVQRFLRHKSVHTTELYIQNINMDLRSVASLLDESTPDGTPNEKEANRDIG